MGEVVRWHEEDKHGIQSGEEIYLSERKH